MNTLIATLTKSVKSNKEWLAICQNRLETAALFEGFRTLEELEYDVREARYTLEVSKCQLRIAIENEKLEFLRNNRS